MAANKNAVKIGLRISAAIALIYLIYHLIPPSSAPLRTSDLNIPSFDKHTIPTTAAPPSHGSQHPNVGSTIAATIPLRETGQNSAHSTSTILPNLSPPATRPVPTPSPTHSRNPSKWTSTTYSDKSLPTPIKHLTLTNSDVSQQPTLLVCVMTKDGSSWGSHDRNFSSFLSMLEWTQLDPTSISLAFLTSSDEQYETYRADTVDTSYASVHLILHPGYKDAGGSRGNRHAGNLQHARRVEMARLRNYATFSTLQMSHKHVLWIDSDVYELSTGLVQSMMNYSTTYPQAGILTAISHFGDGEGDYDFNAWVGERSSPNDTERDTLRKDKGSWQAGSVNGKSKHMGDLRDDLKKRRQDQKNLGGLEAGGAFDPSKAVFDEEDEEPADFQPTPKSHEIEGLFRLDAVGATVLLMKASLWRQGLSFATSYLVGTDWKDEGWDGVESEGLCITARNLIDEEYGRQGGVGCWGLWEGYSRHSSG